MRRPLLILALSLSTVALGACGGGDDGGDSGSSTSTATTAPDGAVMVTMKGIKFQPRDVTVKVGQTVRWTNGESVPHDVDAKSGADFESDLFGEGKSFEHKFTKAGRVEYVCSIHPGMDGTVTVES